MLFGVWSKIFGVDRISYSRTLYVNVGFCLFELLFRSDQTGPLLLTPVTSHLYLSPNKALFMHKEIMMMPL
jgi:hypothetical protein